MGCTASSKVSVGGALAGASSSKSEESQKNRSLLQAFHITPTENSRSAAIANSPGGSGHHNHSTTHHHHHNENVQDEARSFRSKVSAIKMLARQQSSFDSFLKFLDEIGKSEYLICFRDIEEIKKLEEDQIVSRTYALVFRYKALYEDFKMALINGTVNNHSNNHHNQREHNSISSGHGKDNSSLRARLSGSNSNAAAANSPTNSKHLVWDCLGKLKSLDYTSAGGEIILKYLNICQNDLISRLVMPFETYLQSNYYKIWQEEQLELEKQRKQRNKSLASASNSTHLISPRTSIAGTAMTLSNRPNGTGESYADAYPNILIVDDSVITLKITGKTLEQDGHKVEKANNGQIALQLMKSRPYDVVLIDCNMPVMDGFEAVSLFREYERQNTTNLFIPSDVSSISDSQEDPFEKALRKERHLQKQLMGTKQTNNTASDSGKPAGNGELSLKEELEENHEGEGEGEHEHVDEDQKNNKESNKVNDSIEKGVMTLNNAAQAELRLEPKLKRGLTAAHYHQLIIGMSTNIDEETKKRALDAGMDHFLPKPFTLQKFIDTIQQSREKRGTRSAGIFNIGSESMRNDDDEVKSNIAMNQSKLLTQQTTVSTVKESERSSNATADTKLID